MSSINEKEIGKMAAVAEAGSWPPTINNEDDNDSKRGKEVEFITLPEVVYWNYVRPFTPPANRQFVSKRCSTRFPPHLRMSINDAVSLYAKAVGDFVKEKKLWPPIYHIIERNGSKLRPSYGSKTCGDLNAVAKALQLSRDLLDKHLLAIDSPTMRLFECLNLCLADERSMYASIFTGDGSVESMIQHHITTDPSSLDGQLDLEFAFPPTILGYFVGKWVSSKMIDIGQKIDSADTNAFERMVNILVANGADSSAFAQPITEKNSDKINDSRHIYIDALRNNNDLEDDTLERSLLYGIEVFMDSNIIYFQMILDRFEGTSLQDFLDQIEHSHDYYVLHYAKFFHQLYNLLAANVVSKDLLTAERLPAKLPDLDFGAKYNLLKQNDDDKRRKRKQRENNP